MTKPMMDLRALVEKSADTDLLREMLCGSSLIPCENPKSAACHTLAEILRTKSGSDQLRIRVYLAHVHQFYNHATH